MNQESSGGESCCCVGGIGYPRPRLRLLLEGLSHGVQGILTSFFRVKVMYSGDSVLLSYSKIIVLKDKMYFDLSSGDK